MKGAGVRERLELPSTADIMNGRIASISSITGMKRRGRQWKESRGLCYRGEISPSSHPPVLPSPLPSLFKYTTSADGEYLQDLIVKWENPDKVGAGPPPKVFGPFP